MLETFRACNGSVFGDMGRHEKYAVPFLYPADKFVCAILELVDCAGNNSAFGRIDSLD